MGETFEGVVDITTIGRHPFPSVRTIALNGREASIGLYAVSGIRRNPMIALNGKEGSIGLRDAKRERNMFLNPNHEKGKYSALFVGETKAGIMVIRDSAGNDAMTLNGGNNSIALRDTTGRNSIIIDGAKSSLYMHHYAGNSSITFDGAEPKIVVRNKVGRDSIVLDGTIGDISLRNSDCAEEFEISGSTAIEPGTVMVIDNDGKLQSSQKDYDSKVAGVISGAGDYQPGIVLGKGASRSSSATLALMGKVYCKVDAQYSQIDIGDMLTTSRTPGHAMRALDPMRAFGSVIGKSLGKIKEGRGLVPILVALQ
jgi:hypothetical protein